MESKKSNEQKLKKKKTKQSYDLRDIFLTKFFSFIFWIRKQSCDFFFKPMGYVLVVFVFS